jgi:hypothetical protein
VDLLLVLAENIWYSFDFDDVENTNH